MCYLTYTNEETHRIIRENLDRSPHLRRRDRGRSARGTARRIETKIVRFAGQAPPPAVHRADAGSDTEEMYIQGFSSILPEEVQLADAAHRRRGWSTRR